MEEIRKSIVWYEWLYKVSNWGNVKSLNYRRTKKEKNLSVCIMNQYYLVNLWESGSQKTHLVHRLVAEAFIPNNDCKPCINHKTWIKTDNRVKNLEWCTNSENTVHARDILWNRGNRSKKINQYTKDWKLIKTWFCIKDAANSIWLNQNYISDCSKWLKQEVWWYKRSLFI